MSPDRPAHVPGRAPSFVWANQKYRKIYFNMGHNEMDYGTRPSKELSSTFGNEVQNRLILNALKWLGTEEKPQSPGGNQPGNPTSKANRDSLTQ